MLVFIVCTILSLSGVSESTANVENEEMGDSSSDLFTKVVSTGRTMDDTMLDDAQFHDQTEFCRGMYMTMFMDGFHWTMLLPRGHPSSQCLNYFVASWKLESPSQFRGAMLFSFLLALLLELFSLARTKCIRYFVTSKIESNSNRFLHHFSLTFMYGLQALLGYLLMFIAMSYSIELILSVITGLIVGNLLLTRYSDEAHSKSSSEPASTIQSQARIMEEHPTRSPPLLPPNMHSGTMRKRG